MQHFYQLIGYKENKEKEKCDVMQEHGTGRDAADVYLLLEVQLNRNAHDL